MRGITTLGAAGDMVGTLPTGAAQTLQLDEDADPAVGGSLEPKIDQGSCKGPDVEAWGWELSCGGQFEETVEGQWWSCGGPLERPATRGGG